jgi:hypothetical protein
MSNRPSTAVLFSSSVQAMVPDTTAFKLRKMSREAGITVSSLTRAILSQALETEKINKAEWLKRVHAEIRLLERESALCKGRKPAQDSESC